MRSKLSPFLRCCVIPLALLAGCQAANEPDPVDLAETIEPSWLSATIDALAADAMEGRDNLSPGGALAREYLMAEMEAIGLEPAGLQGYQQDFAAGVNLVGRIGGSDPSLSARPVLLTAHYDHLGTAGAAGSQCSSDGQDLICNGAADNASGVAAVLAVARALAESGVPHSRSVWIVLFDAEEDGLLGSRAFVESQELLPVADISAVLNVDTVGTQIFPGVRESFALNSEYNPGLRDAVLTHDPEVGLTTFPVSSFFDGSEQGERSDHYPFHQAGVAALFLSSGATALVHTVADEPDTLDGDKLLGTARHLFLLAHQLADSDSDPPVSAEPIQTVDDAVALLALGEQLLADPEAAGLDDPLMIEVVEGWMDQLQGYVDHPPTTQQGFEEYRQFVRSVIDAVFMFTGR